LHKLRSLGRGSFGHVWLEEDPKTGLKVAVKEVFYNSENQKKVAKREHDILQALCERPHPFVVRAFSIELSKHSCRVVMEYCMGGTLMQQVQKQWLSGECHFASFRCISCAMPEQVQFIPPSSARQWIAEVFLALEYLHLELHILMRDLKLENVLLDEYDRAKLTDFGVGCVHSVSHAPWSFSHPPGSRGYAAPEVLRDEDHNYLADLYSFMVMVWMLLTGGVIDDPDNPTPRPPMRSPKDNHTQCLADFELFQRYLRYPQKYGVASAPDDALDLLWGLAQEPELRMGHAHLRKLTLLQEMEIPPPCATSSQIHQWLTQQFGKPAVDLQHVISR